MFELHPQLEKDSRLLGHFPLSCLLLSLDANYPWFILVPRRNKVREIFELDEKDQYQLMRESNQLAALLADHYRADKMNMAALGNMVPQLHIHHIVRYNNDPAWPSPIWGVSPAKPYTEETMRQRLDGLLEKLQAIDCRIE